MRLLLQIFLYLPILFNGCSNYTIESNNLLLIKVFYSNVNYPEASSVAYALLDYESINEFELIKNDTIGFPQVIYNITANGGYVVVDNFNDVEAYGCCEYGDIEKSYLQLLNGTILNSELSKYSNINKRTLNQFTLDKSISLELTQGTSSYIIDVWLTDLEFCVCELYMRSSLQRSFSKKSALIKSIRTINKPNNKVKEELQNLFELIVFDSK